MKKITLFSVLLFLSHLVFSQSATITLTKDSLCVGQSVMATASPGEQTLSTPTGTNNHNGYMFDVVATYDAVIKGFLINPVTAGGTYYLYYRTGTHVGHENSATGWTLVDSVENVPNTASVNPGFNVSQSIVAGQTLAFYITSKGTFYTYYNNGGTVGNTLASDSYLAIKEGTGKSYPFASSFTTRNFVGSILYEPEVTSYSWSAGGSSKSITKSPNRSVVYGCDLTLSNGAVVSAAATVIAKELEVSASASPSSVSAGQQSTLTAEATLKKGVATMQDGTNSLNGAMFDISASKNLEVTGFTIKPNTTDADIEIFYKTGTHVGFEANSTAWTSIGTYSNIAAKHGQYLALNSPIAMVPGQTIAVYITRTDNDRLQYSNGTTLGSTIASGNGLAIKEGKGIVYPFSTAFSPRVLNCIVHFTVDPVTNATYAWSSGGSSASVVVNPNATTTYNVDVSLGGCTKNASVEVTVGIGLEELEEAGIRVYPNPATHQLTVEFGNLLSDCGIYLMDLNGKVVVKQDVPKQTDKIVLKVEHLAKGLYILRVDRDNDISTAKILVH